MIKAQLSSFESGVKFGDSCRVEMAYAYAIDTLSFSRIFKSTGEGAVIEFYPNGRARMAFCSVPGTLDRIEQWWFEDGALLSQRVVRANGSKGFVRYWFPTGRLRFSAELVDDKKSGRVQEWNDQGVLIRDEQYRSGKLKRARLKGYKL
ncbi:MAG: hypothetical protein JNM91_07890 [Flavobacteriales bacterium]|nr:hypothetical protein [Flavobacteriales bacterium]